MSEFRFVRRRFAPADNLRVRLEETDNLGLGRDVFTLEHAPHRLLNRPFNEGREVGELSHEALSHFIGLDGQGFRDLPSLPQCGPRNAN